MNSISQIGDLFEALGKIIKNIIQAVKDFTDWIGISTFALEESTAKEIALYEKQKAVIKDRYETQRKEAEKTGKSIASLTYEAAKAENQANEMIIRAYRKRIMVGNELTKEEKKIYDELEKLNHDYYQNLLKQNDDYIKETIDKANQLELEIINIKLKELLKL